MLSQSAYEADVCGELLAKDEVRLHGDPFCKSTGGAQPVPQPRHGWSAAEGPRSTGPAAPLQLTQCPLPGVHLESQEKAAGLC